MPPLPGAVPVGSPSGEGFEHMTLTGRVTRMDVDAINDRMRYTGAARHKHVQSPDRAFGLIFNLDHVVVDTRQALADAWAALGAARGLPVPRDTMALATKQVCAERIITDVLGWTRDFKEAKAMSWELGAHFATALASGSGQQGGAPGLRQWLDAVASVGMPCAAVSRLDKRAVRDALARAHLHDHFSVLITAEDECETQAQALLTAAVRLQVPPNHCTVFDDNPQGVTAAHNVSMKAVALASATCPAYKLRAADLTTTHLGSLTVYNVRRLFANAGAEMGDVVQQNSNDKPNNKRPVRNALLEPER